MTEAIFDFLLETFEEVGQMALEGQAHLTSSRKKDKSIVTIADNNISDYIKFKISNSNCAQGYLVDEEIIDRKEINFDVLDNNDSSYIWFVDPIAGTVCYAAGTPLYAISIALFKNNEPYMGGVLLPGFDELFISDSENSWYYPAFTKNKSRSIISVPSLNNEYLPPIFNHSSTRAVKKYNIIQKTIPFVMIPSINVGLMWTALGRFSATLFQAKIWDFAAAWAIFKTMGLELKSVDSEILLEKISSDKFDQDWQLTDAHLVCIKECFKPVRDLLLTK